MIYNDFDFLELEQMKNKNWISPSPYNDNDTIRTFALRWKEK